MSDYDSLGKPKTRYNRNGFINIRIRPLIVWDEPNGDGSIVSDKITKNGWKVGYMCREEPNPDYPDSGWRFFKGDEDEGYLNDSDNSHPFSLNTVCNYDPDIIPHLHAPVGSCFVRTADGGFVEDDGMAPVCMLKQNF